MRHLRNLCELISILNNVGTQILAGEVRLKYLLLQMHLNDTEDLIYLHNAQPQPQDNFLGTLGYTGLRRISNYYPEISSGTKSKGLSKSPGATNRANTRSSGTNY